MSQTESHYFANCISANFSDTFFSRVIIALGFIDFIVSNRFLNSQRYMCYHFLHILVILIICYTRFVAWRKR